MRFVYFRVYELRVEQSLPVRPDYVKLRGVAMVAKILPFCLSAEIKVFPN